MNYILDYMTIGTDDEIRMYRQGDMPTKPFMVRGDNVEPDKYGRKIVPIATFVDKNGDPVKLTKSGFEGEPVGMTHDTKNVTHSPQEVALWTRGHFKGPMINFDEDEYSDEIGAAIQEKFPEMHIYPDPALSAVSLKAKTTQKVEVK